MTNQISTEFKPIDEVELIKKYTAFDNKVYNAVKNYQDRSVTGLILLLAGVVAIGVNSLVNANKQFAVSLGPSDEPQRQSADIKNSTFIELSSNIQHAGEQLLTRLRDKVEVIGKRPEHIDNIKQLILEDFAQEGITTVTYKNGAKFRLSDYVKTVTRTARTETVNSNAVDAALDNGTDLVYMPKFNSTCPICAMYEGRVYSISGKDKRFPSLYATAFSRGYDTIHPNCRHHLQPFFEQYYESTEVKTLERDSNRAFTDNRTRQSAETYAKAQAYNRQILAEIREFDEMKAVFGSELPYRTVGGFRRGKRADSETYDIWRKMFLDVSKQ